MNAIQVQLTDFRNCTNLVDDSTLQLQQVELFLTQFNSNYNYWFNVYKSLINDLYKFSIRFNTIYGHNEINCNNVLHSSYYSLESINNRLSSINRDIAYLSIESDILELSKERAFLQVMQSKLMTFLKSKNEI